MTKPLIVDGLQIFATHEDFLQRVEDEKYSKQKDMRCHHILVPKEQADESVIYVCIDCGKPYLPGVTEE